MMVLGLHKTTKPANKLIEIVGVPGSAKSILADNCAARTNGTFIKLPQLDVVQPIDQALLSSLNNIHSLLAYPKQWGDLYYAYLKRVEEIIERELQYGDVWITNYVHTLNLYQSTLRTDNRYQLDRMPIKILIDAPKIHRYEYNNNLEFFGNKTDQILKFNKRIQQTVNFNNPDNKISTNYKRHPWIYLNDLAEEICSKLKYDFLSHTVTQDSFYKLNELELDLEVEDELLT